MSITPNLKIQHLRRFFTVAFVCFAAVNGFAQSKSAEKPTTPVAPVQLKYEGMPQGNTLADQIVRAEYFKAQYPNDPATQAKYQVAIDDLKKQLAAQNTPDKKD